VYGDAFAGKGVTKLANQYVEPIWNELQDNMQSILPSGWGVWSCPKDSHREDYGSEPIICGTTDPHGCPSFKCKSTSGSAKSCLSDGAALRWDK
jgi:hypothetical protein